MDITLTSTSITLAAKKQVLVNGGGSYMRWVAGSIEEGTAGTRVVHAATHPIVGPDNRPVPPVVLPSGTPREFDPKTDLSFTLLRHAGDGKPVPFEPYVLYQDGAAIARGVTDANGRLVVKDHQAGVSAYTVELASGASYELGVAGELDSQQDLLAAQGYRAAFEDEKNRLAEFAQTRSASVS